MTDSDTAAPLTAEEIAAIQARFDDYGGRWYRNEMTTLATDIALRDVPRLLASHAALRDRLARAETRERAIRGVMREMEEDEKIPRKEGDFTGEVINYYRRELTDALAPTDGAARAGDAT
jgi:hypothetical protein